MKALITAEGAEPPATVQDVPVPEPGEGEMLVKVHYVAQNPTDWKAAAGAPAGLTVGCDFAGTVADANGSHWREGQRVAGWVHGCTADPARGVFAEYAVVEPSLVFAIPDSVPFQEAATIPLAYATATQAMFQRLGIPELSSPATPALPFLIAGGTSSVGLYAVQLARRAGLFVVATASKRNHDLLKKLGADVVVDYREPDWVDQVQRATEDNLQYALDCIGEVDSVAATARTLSSTKGGHLLTILARKQSDIDPSLTKVKVESTIAYSVFGRPLKRGYLAFDNSDGDRLQDRAFWEKQLTLLPEYLEQGKIKSNPVRELGGINDILTGFEEQKQGKVSAEKLVYKIA